MLTLAASGWTYQDTFILYDKETGSLWYHKLGDDGLTGINGFYNNRFLPELPSTKTRWNKWVAEHPDSKIMICRLQPPGVCGNYIDN